MKNLIIKEIEDTVRSRVNVKDLRLKLGEKSITMAVKADGLAAGKGVIICDEREQVLESIDEMLGGKFGSAGHRIVVERCITGPEASFIAMCDGKSHMQLATSQDHKRIGDGNTGPNTGGMGAYSPATVIDAENEKKLDQIMAKTVDGMRSEGNAFVGFLYAGVIFEDNAPYVLEFNVRMGDPECQAILPRMDSDLFEYAQACTQGTLDAMPQMRWKKQSSVCVILASKGYPGKYPTGETISGIKDAAKISTIYHAGTQNKDNEILTNGGRVLGVSALGDSLSDASSAAYRACDMIRWQNKYCRTDIGRVQS